MPPKANNKDAPKGSPAKSITMQRRAGRAVLAADIVVSNIQDASEVSFYAARRKAIKGASSVSLEGAKGVNKGQTVASWVDLTQDEDHLRAEQEANRDIVRESNETQQLFILWDDILRPDFTGEVERKFKPYCKYLQRIVHKVVRTQLHDYLFQERIQRIIFAILKTKPAVKMIVDEPARSELVHSVERTSLFWDQLALAQSNAAKTLKGHLVDVRPVDSDSEDDQATRPPPSNIRPRHQILQAISPRKWPGEARGLLGLQRKTEKEGSNERRLSMYLDELFEESEERSAHPSRAQSRQGDHNFALPGGVGRPQTSLDKVFEAGDFRGQTPVQNLRGSTPNTREPTPSSRLGNPQGPGGLPTLQPFGHGARSPNKDNRAASVNSSRSHSSMGTSRNTRGYSPERAFLTSPISKQNEVMEMQRRAQGSPSRGAVGHWKDIRSEIRKRGIDMEDKDKQHGKDAKSHAHSSHDRRDSGTVFTRSATPQTGAAGPGVKSSVGAAAKPDPKASWTMTGSTSVGLRSFKRKSPGEDEDSNGSSDSDDDGDGDDDDDDEDQDVEEDKPLPPSWPMERVIASRAASRQQADALDGMGYDITSTWVEKTAQVRYFRKCKQLGILPQPVRVFIHDNNVHDTHQNAVELPFRQKLLNGGANLQALASAIPAFHDISLIDISHNSLDDSSVAYLLDTLCRVAKSRNWNFLSLEDLRLGYNKLGSKTLKALKACCEEEVFAFEGLKLNLSGVHFDATQFDLLCRICTQRSGLVQLQFEEMQLGRFHQGPCRRSVDLVIACRNLLTLEMGWNHFREEGLFALSDALRKKTCKISTLSLAGNGCAVVRTQQIGLNREVPSEVLAPPHPMLAFCESLRDCHSLTKLNLSSCSLGAQACVCIEASLKAHAKLTELDLSHNPLGEDGLRSLLRHTCLRLLDTSWHCNVGQLRESMDISDVEFNYRNLSAEYRGTTGVHLSHPYHRAVMQLLLHRAQELGKGPEQVLQGCVYNGHPIKASNLDFKLRKDGLWQVPHSGVLEFTFFSVDQIQFSSALDLVTHWHKMRRIYVSLLKFVHVCGMWQQLRSDVVRLLFVSAISKDMQLRVGQVRFFVMQTAQSRPHLVPQVMLALCTALATKDRTALSAMMRTGHEGALKRGAMSKKKFGGKRNRNVDPTRVYSSILTPGQRRVLTRQLRSVATTNMSNPTGHYELNLELPHCYLLAENLILINRWEADLARERGEPDTSQSGNHQAIRNLELDNVHFGSLDDFYLPGDGFVGSGVLFFDFCSQVRLAKGASFLREATFTSIMTLLSRKSEEVSEVAQAEAMKGMTHRFFVSAVQLRLMLLKFGNENLRLDLYCSLFPRCTQFGAPIVHRQRGVLGDRRIFPSSMMKMLVVRLGLTNTLDVDNLHEHPWNEFTLDFEVNEHRSVGDYLMVISEEEPGVNIAEPEYSEWKGTNPFFVPSGWMESLPPFGIFSCRYEAEREEWIYYKFRKEKAVELFGWLTLEDS